MFTHVTERSTCPRHRQTVILVPYQVVRKWAMGDGGWGNRTLVWIKGHWGGGCCGVQSRSSTLIFFAARNPPPPIPARLTHWTKYWPDDIAHIHSHGNSVCSNLRTRLYWCFKSPNDQSHVVITTAIKSSLWRLLLFPPHFQSLFEPSYIDIVYKTQNYDRKVGRTAAHIQGALPYSFMDV